MTQLLHPLFPHGDQRGFSNLVKKSYADTRWIVCWVMTRKPPLLLFCLYKFTPSYESH